MPVFAGHPGAAFNVEGSFNDYFARFITAQGLPAFMPSAVVNYEYPDKPLTYPSFSVTHLGSQPQEIAQGRHLDNGWVGARRMGLVEIDVWASDQAASGQGDLQVSQMRDMVARVFANGPSIPITDVYGSTAAPTSNGTIIRTSPVQDGARVPDPNKDVFRRRMIVPIHWEERVSAT
jgi:hypothetical protein